jgi:hypothetical protein
MRRLGSIFGCLVLFLSLFPRSVEATKKWGADRTVTENTAGTVEFIWGTSTASIGLLNLTTRTQGEHPYVWCVLGMGMAAGSFALAAWDEAVASDFDAVAGFVGIIGALGCLARHQDPSLAPKGEQLQVIRGKGMVRVSMGFRRAAVEFKF